jgi:wobble nucleotide-excising tRNase
MIKKILEIKNLGIFKYYRWRETIPDFERFNIIYGWNGSGKTILSQLFSALESGELSTYPDLMYKIVTGDGEYSQGMPYGKQIRVFNQHYISENIDVVACRANPIFILGEDNKILAEQIRDDERILRGDPEKPEDLGLLKESELCKSELQQKKKDRDKLFTDIARTISSNLVGASTRTYRKNNAEKDFAELESQELLSDIEKKRFDLTIRQQEKSHIEELVSNDIEEVTNAIVSDANSLLETTVEIIMIDRLIKNSDISQWVEEGYKLHLEKESKNCEFCNQPLPKERISELAAFFNEADKKLKDDIDNLLNKINDLYTKIQKINATDKANFYTELQSEYLNSVEEFINTKQYLLERILDLKEEVENKKLRTTESVKLSTSIDTTKFLSSVNGVNIHIQTHNEKSRNFSDAKKEAEEKLRKHYLSEISDEVKKYDSDIADINQKIDLLEHGDPNDPHDIGITGLKKRINENKNKISQSGLACDEINHQLEIFLGRRELVFEVDKEGYTIRRHGEIAKNLSEGEKTAIAFVYFTISLKDREFDVENGIVVIDDPISSLDSNSLFQAFAFLKNTVSNASQVFILTHNYDFLQLLLNWLKSKPKSQGKKTYCMINNHVSNGRRTASIDVLDKLLINYTSEYQYLFKLLYTFTPDGTIGSVYHLPNIARKVLDNFLMIIVPNNQSSYKKLEQIEFETNKKTAIYKFTNDQSHITGKGFNPSLVSEAQNNISYLLEMMETVFPEHYDVLKKSATE